MSNDRNRPSTSRIQLTPEAFRELAETAVAELYDSVDVLEIQDLRGWCKALTRKIGEVSDHAESGADVSEMGGLRLCDAAGN
jgi:hypothetical protein